MDVVSVRIEQLQLPDLRIGRVVEDERQRLRRQSRSFVRVNHVHPDRSRLGPRQQLTHNLSVCAGGKQVGGEAPQGLIAVNRQTGANGQFEFGSLLEVDRGSDSRPTTRPSSRRSQTRPSRCRRQSHTPSTARRPQNHPAVKRPPRLCRAAHPRKLRTSRPQSRRPTRDRSRKSRAKPVRL